jgi:hypothetical protein
MQAPWRGPVRADDIGAARHRLKARLRPGGQTAFLAERLFAIDSAKKHERVTADLL